MLGIDTIIGAGLKIIDKFITDPSEKLRAQQELQRMSHEEVLAFLNADLQLATSQIEVNREEAKNPNLFVSGWRPAVGWTCALAFAWTFVFQPVALFILAALGIVFPLPTIPMEALMTVLVGMLGLGGFRTLEKFKGVARQA